MDSIDILLEILNENTKDNVLQMQNRYEILKHLNLTEALIKLNQKGMEQLSHGEFKKSYDCLKGAERLVKIGGYIEHQKARANGEALGATTGFNQVVDEAV